MSVGSALAAHPKAVKVWDEICYWAKYVAWLSNCPRNAASYFDPASEACVLVQRGWEQEVTEYNAREPKRPEKPELQK